MKVWELVEGKLLPTQEEDGNNSGSTPSPISDEIEKLWSALARRKSFQQPTEIQRRVWTQLQCSTGDGSGSSDTADRSLIFIASTGSGKTLAYGIPLLLASCKNSLVIVPTRELAIQVRESLLIPATLALKTLHGQKISVFAFYGGTKQEPVAISKNSNSIVIGTPGRLLDMLQRTKEQESFIHFVRHVHTVVLDEADKLTLHSDLLPQIQEILDCCNGNRQRIILCSATMPDAVLPQWNQWTAPSKATRVLLQDQPGLSSIPPNLTQTIHVCAEHKKPRKLVQTLKKSQGIIIVFVNKIAKLDHLRKLVPGATVLHSHKTQKEREIAIQTIRRRNSKILLTTDLAARGIDLKISTVINYDFPSNLETYIHRCGRAGRDGSAATVFSFFTRNLKPLVPDLISLLEQHKQWVDPNLKELLSDENSTKERPPKRQKIRKDDDEDDDDEFANLSANRIVLKRAGNVSDASSDSSSSSDEDQADRDT